MIAFSNYSKAPGGHVPSQEAWAMARSELVPWPLGSRPHLCLLFLDHILTGPRPRSMGVPGPS